MTHRDKADLLGAWFASVTFTEYCHQVKWFRNVTDDLIITLTNADLDSEEFVNAYMKLYNIKQELNATT